MKIIKLEKVPDKNVLTRVELRDFILEKLEGKLSKNFCLRMADLKYYLPPLEYAKEIIDNSRMKDMTNSGGNPRGERFDCDDFALILKARFAFDAYRKNVYHNFPHCFGIVWGMLPCPIPHSLNWMITADENGDKKFHFVEPQKQQIVPPEMYKNYRYINFILV